MNHDFAFGIEVNPCVIEITIGNARKYYNAVVRNYNNKTEMFPSSIVANMFKFGKRQMFVIEDEAEKEAVKVQF